MAEPVLQPVVRYLRCAIVYEAAIAMLSTAVVWHAHSQAAVFPLIFAVGGVLCLFLMLYTVKAAVKGDLDRYPYGTGRLENLSAILLSMMITVGTVIPLTQAVRSLLAGDPRPVSMGWTSLLLLVSAVGNGLQSHLALRLHRSRGSPILSSLYHVYFVGFVRDACSCAVIGLCWALAGSNRVFMSHLDSFATVGLGCYSLSHFLPQIWENFRSLADFPTSEQNRIKIMGILAKHFDRYEMPGLIYTTNKGRTEVFEVELAFSPDMTVGALIELENAMREDFRRVFPNCVFRIIPVPNSAP
jgi:divalent metal cation (Fe/Co/Zn/Cd) transporter